MDTIVLWRHYRFPGLLKASQYTEQDFAQAEYHMRSISTVTAK